MGGGQARGVGAVRGLAPTSPLNSSSLYSVDLLQPCFCANEFTKKKDDDDDDDDDDDEGSRGRPLWDTPPIRQLHNRFNSSGLFAFWPMYLLISLF